MADSTCTALYNMLFENRCLNSVETWHCLSSKTGFAERKQAGVVTPRESMNWLGVCVG